LHKSGGRSTAGVVKARRREYFIRGVFSTPSGMYTLPQRKAPREPGRTGA
jgi:hypothetical protein